MSNKPGPSDFTPAEWRLVQKLNSPRKVQKFLTAMPYNWERHGGTMRSFREVVKRDEAHCLEAAVAAAVILEQHGYPPLLLDLASKDLLDHVLFVFQDNGHWGSIGRSRDFGLHGRLPRFRSLRDLVWSYFDPYIDYSGRILGYGLGNLNELGNYDWRFSRRNMHKIEDYLREIPHKTLVSSDSRYKFFFERYKRFKKRFPDKSPKYFDDQHTWML